MKQQVNYDILIRYINQEIHFKSSDNISRLLLKICLGNNWHDILLGELNIRIEEFSEYILREEVKPYLHYYILSSLLTKYRAFEIEEPILPFEFDAPRLKGKHKKIEDYFFQIINIFSPQTVSDDESDEFVFNDDMEQDLAYWIELNKEKLSEYHFLDELDFPGLKVLIDVIDKLYYIAFLNSSIKKKTFDFDNINLPMQGGGKLNKSNNIDEKNTFFYTKKIDDELIDLFVKVKEMENPLFADMTEQDFLNLFKKDKVNFRKIHVIGGVTRFVHFVEQLINSNYISAKTQQWAVCNYCFDGFSKDSLKSTKSNANYYNSNFSDIKKLFLKD